MPRKKDGLPFEVHRSPKASEDGSVILYASPLSDCSIGFSKIEEFLSLKNAVSKGELQRSLDAFLDECVRWLGMGYRVQTPLGVFSLKLGMKRTVTNPREVRHDDVEFKGIEFRPSAEFSKSVRDIVGRKGFRYVHKADSTVLMANETYMMKSLKESIHPEEGYTTVSNFMLHSGLSKYAATKQLKQWCLGPHPRLRQRKLGHSIIYELTEP